MTDIMAAMGSASLCATSMSVWLEWQGQTGPSHEGALPEHVRQALDHVASCPDCKFEAARLTAVMALEPEQPRERLAEFLAETRKHGLARASAGRPATAKYLLRKPSALAMSRSVQRAVSRGFTAEDLPQDVEYTIASQMEPGSWGRLFIRNFGLGASGRLSCQPAMALGFHIGVQPTAVSFNMRPILGLAKPSSTAMRITTGDCRSVGEANGQRTGNEFRAVAIENQKGTPVCHVEVSARGRWALVRFPSGSTAAGGEPFVCLLSEAEGGGAVLKRAHSRAGTSEVGFSGLADGSHVLAIDIQGQSAEVLQRLPIYVPDKAGTEVEQPGPHKPVPRVSKQKRDVSPGRDGAGPRGIPHNVEDG